MHEAKPKAVDLFAGAGGLTLGLHEAGFETVAAIEYNQNAAETYTQNFPGTDVYAEDIREVNLAPYTGIDLLVGGPPCQPFSVAGKQLASNDPRDMVPQFIKAVDRLRPKAFPMENVRGMISSRNKPYASAVLGRFRKLGYDVEMKLHNAAHFGVPQNRKRVLIVGVRGAHQFSFPDPTHGPEGDLPLVTAGEAIAASPEDDPNGSKVTYAKNPVLRSSPFSGMLVNGGGRPINLGRPSPTISASAGGNRTHIVDKDGVLVEYHEHLMNGGKPRRGEVKGVRRLTISESARLQSFPANFEFVGSKSAQYSQIGNAVPPLLAQAIGEALLEGIFRI